MPRPARASPFHRLRRSLSRRAKQAAPHVSHWLSREFAAVVFVVCFVTVLHQSELLGPIGSLSAIVASHAFAVGEEQDLLAPDVDHADALVEVIDEERFRNVYEERRPLDRCKLLADLRLVVASHPRVVAIDFDLSPLAHPTAGEHACQTGLDDLVAPADPIKSGEPAPPTYLLVRPDERAAVRLPKADAGAYVARQRAWERRACDAGARFARDELDLSLGVATSMACDDRNLAEMADATARGVEARCRSHSPLQPVDYRYFLRHVRVLPVEQARSQVQRAGMVVFFGGIYGDDDLHATPIGDLYGVQLHAARFATLHAPHAERLWKSLLIDLLLAVLFSAVAQPFVHEYAHLAGEKRYWHAQRRVGVMTCFLFVFVALQLATLWLCGFLLARGMWIEPLLISLGVGIDAFLVTPWRSMGHAAQAASRLEWRDGFVQGFRTDRAGALWQLSATLLFWAVVGRCLCLVVQDLLPSTGAHP